MVFGDAIIFQVAVHGAGGLVGLLCVPWFMYAGLEEGKRGIFWDGATAHPWLGTDKQTDY